MRVRGYGHRLRFFLSLFGRIRSAFGTRTTPLPPALLDPQSVAAAVSHGRRWNNYLALEPDVFLFGDAEGFLAYGGMGNTLLSVGGVHGSFPIQVLIRWKGEARKRGFKRLMLFPVHAAEQRLLRDAGFSTLHVGSEAILHLPGFDLEGSALRNLRQTIHRAERSGTLTLAEESLSDNPELERLFDAWLQSRIRDFRMRILVGSPGFGNPLGRRVFVVRRNGKAEAFTTITPGFSGSGWGMDIMARDPAGPPGMMEWMIAEMAFRLKSEGALTLSLGACPMRLMEEWETSGSPYLNFIFKALYGKVERGRLFRFRELARFKEKFDPEWVPVFLGGSPRINWIGLYDACRMWGLFDDPSSPP